jgi:hypothetical protein
MPFVIAPDVGDREGLEDSTDRLAGVWPEQEVEVIGYRAIAAESEGVSVLGPGQGLDEGDTVAVVAKAIPAVVASIEGVIDQAVIDGAR